MALLVELMEMRERAEESSDDPSGGIDECVARFRALSAELPSLFDARSFGEVGRRLAEMKTLARLVDDLGGPKLIATLSDR